MANLKEGWSQRWPSRIAEKFVPTSFWTQDAKGNYFLDIDLPGFKHEEVRIELASDGRIKIEGERIMNDNKCIYIDQTFPLPENSDTENIVGKFEAEHLLVTVPKMNSRNIANGTAEQSSLEADQEDDERRGHGRAADIQSSDDDINTKGKSSNETRHVATENDRALAIAIKFVKGNKGVVLAVVISFSIGVWVSKLWI